MEVFTTPETMRAWSRTQRVDGHRLALVPTMGALHDGHFTLIASARGIADRVIVTIFVNPLQFNQPADFDSYPRPIDDDLLACSAAGADAVYAPTASTMYAPEFQTHVVPGDLANRLEGPKRPGHFRGVATVVAKLFGATTPDVAFFGEKDFQQLAILRQMTKDLDFGIEIVGVPIVRESDGLARSSRNVRLTHEDRAVATVLSRALDAGQRLYESGVTDAAEVIATTTALIADEPRASLEYVELVDAATLRNVTTIDDPVALLTAAWFGDVRLIDNHVFGPHAASD